MRSTGIALNLPAGISARNGNQPQTIFFGKSNEPFAKTMMYGLVGLAGTTKNLTALHAHHHAHRDSASVPCRPRLTLRAHGSHGLASPARGAEIPAVLYASDHLPPRRRAVLASPRRLCR